MEQKISESVIKIRRARGESISKISKDLKLPYTKVWTILNREKVRRYQREYQSEHPEYHEDWIKKNRKKWNEYMRKRMRKKK